MARTEQQLRDMAARMETLVALAQAQIKALEPLIAAEFWAAVTPEVLARHQERVAAYTTAMKSLMTAGDTPPPPASLTGSDAASAYVTAQGIVADVGEIGRKFRALTVGTIEDAPVTAAQKTVWEGKLDAALASLQTKINQQPKEAKGITP